MNKPSFLSLFAATLLVGFYFVTGVYIASRRLFWSDEVITALIARWPHLSGIWDLAARGADTMPPAYHLVVRAFEQILGQSAVGARLPSAFAVAAGLLVTFDAVRRLTDGLHGLGALAFLTCSFLPSFGYEARSYGLYFLFSALALWVWLHLSGARSAFWFGSVLFLCTTIHYYSVLCLVPYAAFEVLNWKVRRPPSRPLMAGALGVSLAFAVHAELLVAAHRILMPNLGGRPRLPALFAQFSALFPDGLFPAAMIALGLALLYGGGKLAPASMQPEERLGRLFLLIPPAGFVLAQLTHGFRPRYFICALPGLGVAFALWLRRQFPERRWVTAGIVILLTGVGALRQLSLTRYPEAIDIDGQQTSTRRMLSLEDTLWNEGKRFNVVCSQTLYLESWFSSRHPDRYSVAAFSDKVDRAHSSLLSFQQLHSEVALARYYPLQFWRIEDFRAHAGEVALIAPFDATLEVLRKAGFRPVVRFVAPLEVVYLEPDTAVATASLGQ